MSAPNCRERLHRVDTSSSAPSNAADERHTSMSSAWRPFKGWPTSRFEVKRSAEPANRDRQVSVAADFGPPNPTYGTQSRASVEVDHPTNSQTPKRAAEDARCGAVGLLLHLLDARATHPNGGAPCGDVRGNSLAKKCDLSSEP